MDTKKSWMDAVSSANYSSALTYTEFVAAEKRVHTEELQISARMAKFKKENERKRVRMIGMKRTKVGCLKKNLKICRQTVRSVGILKCYLVFRQVQCQWLKTRKIRKNCGLKN